MLSLASVRLLKKRSNKSPNLTFQIRRMKQMKFNLKSSNSLAINRQPRAFRCIKNQGSIKRCSHKINHNRSGKEKLRPWPSLEHRPNMRLNQIQS